jgi:hypothetical protein
VLTIASYICRDDLGYLAVPRRDQSFVATVEGAKKIDVVEKLAFAEAIEQLKSVNTALNEEITITDSPISVI